MNRQGRKYQIYAWDTEDESTEIWTSRGLLRKLITAWLEKLGWAVADRPGEAELLVLLPRSGYKCWSIDDLILFGSCVGGKKLKRVLCIYPLFGREFSSEIISDWYFIIKKPHFSWIALKQWLNSPRPVSHVDNSFKLYNILRHLAYAIDPNGVSLYSYGKKVRGLAQKEPSLSKFAIELLQRKSIKERVSFFYGLITLKDTFSSIEHDINRAMKSKVDSSEWKDLHEKKNFISACNDICYALYAKEMSSQSSQNSVLLIDDNPTNIDLKQLNNIFKTFLHGFNLIIWNPSSYGLNKKPLNLRNIERYQSVHQKQEGNTGEPDILSMKVNIERIKTIKPGWNGKVKLIRERKPRDIKDILTETRFIIVDILFKDSNNHDFERGHGVIRGLHRLCRDYRKHLKGNSDGASGWLLPHIIAISYADDMEKAQTAFASGAGGFIVKNRLLALPGVLAKCRHDILEPANTPHQTFRSLYRLPHETLGLLRSIPVLKRQFDNANNYKENIKREHTHNRSHAFAKLLAACPKTDLHAHVGSCMTPEFLIISSIVMLLRHEAGIEKASSFNKISKAIPEMINFWKGNKYGAFWHFPDDWNVLNSTKIFCFHFDSKCIEDYAKQLREFFTDQINNHDQDRKRYARLRSVLDKGLGIPAHWNEKKLIQAIEGKLNMELFLFGMTHSGPEGTPLLHDKDDVLRIYLLYIASEYNKQDVSVSWDGFIKKMINLESWNDQEFYERWNTYRDIFYSRTGELSVSTLRNKFWRLKENDLKVHIELGRLYDGTDSLLLNYKTSEIFFQKDPIGFFLATGTRCSNLKTYLDGCEISGSEHLKHPWLIHLYAQQTVFGFIKQGVLYAELRAAASGYENANIEFSFKDACDCMTQAFSHAQKLARDHYCNSSTPENSKGEWIWEHPFSLENAFNGQTGGHFPVKVNIILTGKRHKPTSEMIRESSAGVVLNRRPPEKIRSAADLLREGFKECRIVGFDLAGPEEGYPPLEFRAEYERIAKMNIPITAHAGENAPTAYVESAIHDLRAKRLGHGLSLADNPQLMNRAREDGVCIELCPVSNFQTNPFAPANSNSEGSNLREYPLRLYLKNGNVVCINTDNPVISNTNMVKECFQASYAYGGRGLPIWELLRILRMGFTKAFLHLPERSALLELADQIVFDLFSKEDVMNLLKVLSKTTSTENSN